MQTQEAIFASFFVSGLDDSDRLLPHDLKGLPTRRLIFVYERSAYSFPEVGMTRRDSDQFKLSLQTFAQISPWIT